MITRKVIIVLFSILLCLNATGSSVKLWTKARFKNVEILKHFWKSTGLSPPVEPKLRKKFLLNYDEKLNLDFIGALPSQAIRLIRIHWLLDLVTVRQVFGDGPTLLKTRNIRHDLRSANQVDDSKGEAGEPVFHLEILDRLIDQLYRNDLRPIFELMGNPSNYFQDFKHRSKYWVSLLEHIMKHYTELYGADYVHGWNFELLNEPDLKQYNSFNFTLEEYLDYFRASEKALPGVSGPAGLFRKDEKAHPLCWGFLDYCNSNPCNLNMITFHRKGGEVGSQVVEGSLDLINTLISRYPNLKGIPFGNSEADIMKGWYKPEEWRADVRYAASVVQVIIGYVEEFFVRRNIPVGLLSNDNAFLSFSPHYFTQRTLLARFQINDTTPRHVQFFRKPVYSVMGLLSLLGDYLTDVRYHPGEKGFSYLATSYKYEDTFLGVITDDRVTNETYVVSNGSYVDVDVRIALGNLTLSGMCVGYIMDNDNSNPYQVWRDAGSPDFPDEALRRRMREAEGFKRLFRRRVKPHQSRLKFYLSSVLVPSVIAVHVCFEGTHVPGQITDLHYANVTRGEIILFWKDILLDSRCILTYVVEFKQVGDSDFRRLNKKDFIFRSYHHDGVAENGSVVGIAGDYRVAAVDYWNRCGPFSDTLTILG